MSIKCLRCVRLMSMVLYCLQLLVVCLQSSCDEHCGGVLLIVEWHIESMLHIIFVIPMIVNDVNLSIAFRGVTVA
jgi:hypothetical protein